MLEARLDLIEFQFFILKHIHHYYVENLDLFSKNNSVYWNV